MNPSGTQTERQEHAVVVCGRPLFFLFSGQVHRLPVSPSPPLKGRFLACAGERCCCRSRLTRKNRQPVCVCIALLWRCPKTRAHACPSLPRRRRRAGLCCCESLFLSAAAAAGCASLLRRQIGRPTPSCPFRLCAACGGSYLLRVEVRACSLRLGFYRCGLSAVDGRWLICQS